MFGKLGLICWHDFPVLRNVECPRAHVVVEPDVYCLFGSLRVLSFSLHCLSRYTQALQQNALKSETSFFSPYMAWYGDIPIRSL